MILSLRRGPGLFAVLFWIFLGFQPLEASSGLTRIRDNNPSRTPCGVYLGSVFDSTMGKRIAGFDRKEIRAALSKIDFSPRLIYVDRKTNKIFKTSAELLQAFKEGRARPIIDQPALFQVGLPHWGSGNSEVPGRAEAEKELDQILEEMGLADVYHQTISRVVKPDWKAPGWAKPAVVPFEISSAVLQRAYDQLPLMFGRDYQKPHRGEAEAMLAKLVVANSLQQAILFAGKSTGEALVGGGLNYSNSAATGLFRKIISNWFNRAQSRDTTWINPATGQEEFILSNFLKNEAEDLTRKTLLTGFFTYQLYIGSLIARASIYGDVSAMEELSLLTSVGGAAAFAGAVGVAKSGAILGSLFWRNFYYKAILGWEARMEREGRKDDARRTAGRFELLGTLIATPAFLFASMASDAYQLFGLVDVSVSHGVMLGMGALFAAHHFGEGYRQKRLEAGVDLPTTELGRWRHQAGWSISNLLAMDPWIDRFDRVHDGVRWSFGQVGKPIRLVCRGTMCAVRASQLPRLADWIEKKAREYFGQRYTEADIARENPGYEFDLGDIPLDAQLQRLIEQDPQLVELIRKDPGLQRLVRNSIQLRVAQLRAEETSE